MAFYGAQISRAEEFTETTVIQGYRDRPLVQNESFSARDLIWHRLRQEKRLEGLENLAENVVKRRREKRRLVASGKRAQLPTRIALTDAQTSAWIHELADLSVPLSKLARAIPQKLKGKYLLEELVKSRVDLRRAIWLVKAVGSAEIRLRQDNLSRATSAEYVKEWTALVFDVLREAMTERPSEDSSFRYFARLVSVMRDETLLDLAELSRLLYDAEEMPHISQTRLAHMVAILSKEGTSSSRFEWNKGQAESKGSTFFAIDCPTTLDEYPLRVQLNAIRALTRECSADTFWTQFSPSLDIVVALIIRWACSPLQRERHRPYQAADLLSYTRIFEQASEAVNMCLWDMGDADFADLNVTALGDLVSQLCGKGFSIGPYLRRLLARGVRHASLAMHARLLVQLDEDKYPGLQRLLKHHLAEIFDAELSKEVRDELTERCEACMTNPGIWDGSESRVRRLVYCGLLGRKERESIGKGLLLCHFDGHGTQCQIIAITRALVELHLYAQAVQYLCSLLEASIEQIALHHICEILMDHKETFVAANFGNTIAVSIWKKLEYIYAIGSLGQPLLRAYQVYYVYHCDDQLKTAELRLKEIKQRLRAPARRFRMQTFYPEIQCLRDPTIGQEDIRDIAQAIWLQYSSNDDWLFTVITNSFSLLAVDLTGDDSDLGQDELVKRNALFLEHLDQLSWDGITKQFQLALRQRLQDTSFVPIARKLVAQLEHVLVLDDLLPVAKHMDSNQLQVWLPLLKQSLFRRTLVDSILLLLCRLAAEKEYTNEICEDLLKIIVDRARAEPWLVLDVVSCQVQWSPQSIPFLRKLSDGLQGVVGDLREPINPFNFHRYRQWSELLSLTSPSSDIWARFLFEKAGTFLDSMVIGHSVGNSRKLLGSLGKDIIERATSFHPLADPAQRLVDVQAMKILVEQAECEADDPVISDLRSQIMVVLRRFEQDLPKSYVGDSDNAQKDDSVLREEVAVSICRLLAITTKICQKNSALRSVFDFLGSRKDMTFSELALHCLAAIEASEDSLDDASFKSGLPNELETMGGGHAEVSSHIRRLLSVDKYSQDDDPSLRLHWSLFQKPDLLGQPDVDTSTCQGPASLVRFHAILLERQGPVGTTSDPQGQIEYVDGWRSLLDLERRKAKRHPDVLV